MAFSYAKTKIAEIEKDIRNIRKMSTAQVQMKSAQEFADEVAFYTEVIEDSTRKTGSLAKDLRALEKSRKELAKARKTSANKAIVAALDEQISEAQEKIAQWSVLGAACSEMLQEARMLSPKEWKAAKVQSAQDEITRLEACTKPTPKLSGAEGDFFAAVHNIVREKYPANIIINEIDFNDKLSQHVNELFSGQDKKQEPIQSLNPIGLRVAKAPEFRR